MKAPAKLRRILQREGFGGLIARLRFTRPDRLLGIERRIAPGLARRVLIIDHGHPEIAAQVRATLAAAGIEVVPHPAGKPLPPRTAPGALPVTLDVWHIGCPGRADQRAVVMVTAPAGRPARLRAHGLVLDHDPDRLVRLSRRLLGRPHYLAYRAELAELAGSIRRALVFLGALSPAALSYAGAMRSGGPMPRLCLTLREFPDRTAAFTSHGPRGMVMVEGLRRMPGWSGAAFSYRNLARDALAAGHDRLLVSQDDAQVTPGGMDRIEAALRYWQGSGADLLSGLISDIDDGFHVTQVVRVGEETMVHLNRNIGLVFTAFGPRALERLAAWETAAGASGPTVDRYLRRFPIETVVPLPFLVRHAPDLPSSMWNFGNRRYAGMIDYSERRLAEMAHEFLAAQAAQANEPMRAHGPKKAGR